MFLNTENSWEPFESMYNQTPSMVEDFKDTLNSVMKQRWCDEAIFICQQTKKINLIFSSATPGHPGMLTTRTKHVTTNSLEVDIDTIKWISLLRSRITVISWNQMEELILQRTLRQF